MSNLKQGIETNCELEYIFTGEDESDDANGKVEDDRYDGADHKYKYTLLQFYTSTYKIRCSTRQTSLRVDGSESDDSRFMGCDVMFEEKLSRSRTTVYHCSNVENIPHK